MGIMIWNETSKHVLVAVLLLVTIIIVILILTDIDKVIQSFRTGFR